MNLGKSYDSYGGTTTKAPISNMEDGKEEQEQTIEIVPSWELSNGETTIGILFLDHGTHSATDVGALGSCNKRVGTMS